MGRHAIRSDGYGRTPHRQSAGHAKAGPGSAPRRMIAALYDIHGNLPALEAVLADVRAAGVDQIVVGGDVFPGPMACESLALLQSLALPVAFIHGNGDREVLNLMRDQHTGG